MRAAKAQASLWGCAVSPKSSLFAAVFGSLQPVKAKPACSATETSKRLEISDIDTRDIILSRQRIKKTLIRLRGSAGWSASLLFAYGIKRFSHDMAQIRLWLRMYLLRQNKRQTVPGNSPQLVSCFRWTRIPRVRSDHSWSVLDHYRECTHNPWRLYDKLIGSLWLKGPRPGQCIRETGLERWPYMDVAWVCRHIEALYLSKKKEITIIIMIICITVNFLNIRTRKKIVVITLKFELCGSTIEKWVQTMQTEWETV